METEEQEADWGRDIQASNEIRSKLEQIILESISNIDNEVFWKIPP